MFIKERSARLTEDLLGQNRKAIRIIVGLLTGHCRLNKHMSLMGLAEEATCRFCSEEEETAVHVLCQCEGLARLRFLILGEENPSASSYTKAPLSRLWSLIQRTQLDRPQEDIKISGHVSWVGKSSLEVVVWLEQMANDVWNKITRALFVLAARNSTNTGPAIINAIEPADDRERAILSGGEDRKKKRIELMKSHILKVMPSNDEQKIIYDLYSRSTSMEGRQRFLPPGAVWMKDGTLSSIVFPHPEDRNLHNTVFGGFIMRHAAELAWVLGYRYSKYRPKLKSISDINFQKPLAVSSLMEMHAYIVYTHLNFLQIMVFVEVYIPTSSKRYTSNTIHFTYQVPEVVNEILPLTYEDAMMYIHGKRHFDEVMTDKK
ncbi:hypothetical protein NQ315_003634, partial [Exocentrus adspersus]